MSEKKLLPDPLFEAFIKDERPGTRDAARLLYYGPFGYDILCEEHALCKQDVVPHPPRPPNRGILIARHDEEDEDRALELVNQFETHHPGRHKTSMYVPPDILSRR